MSPMKHLFKRMIQRFKVEGTEEKEKKFLISYGVGEAFVETNEGRITVSNVLFTPEITLNILSLDQLEEQGYMVSYGDNNCRIKYMFDNMEEAVEQETTIEEEDEESIIKSHNNFLDGYFRSLDLNEECSLIKGMEDLKMNKEDVHDYVDNEYLSLNGTLYVMKVNTFPRFVSFLDLIKIDKLVYGNWEVLKGKFMEMLEWFYLGYLKQDVLGELPPVIGVIRIDLLGLYKFVDVLGGYMNVTFNDKWYQVAKLLGLAYEHHETVKEVYKEYIGMTTADARLDDEEEELRIRTQERSKTKKEDVNTWKMSTVEAYTMKQQYMKEDCTCSCDVFYFILEDRTREHVKNGIKALGGRCEPVNAFRRNKYIKEIDVKKDSSGMYACLFQGLPEDLQMQVAGCETAKEIWDSLKARFIGTEDVQQAHSQQLKSEFERLVMKEDETIDSFAGKLMSIITKAATCGLTGDLSGKLKTYDERALSLEKEVNEDNSEKLLFTRQGNDRNYERNYGNDRRGGGNQTRGRGQGRFARDNKNKDSYDRRRRNPGDQNYHKRDIREIECYNCHEFGHYAANCPKPDCREEKANLCVSKMRNQVSFEANCIP
ncbi:ARID DNA-binding domain-containing protein [Tanacetum coccineum]